MGTLRGGEWGGGLLEGDVSRVTFGGTEKDEEEEKKEEDARKVAQDIGFVKDRYPEVAQNLGLFKFPGRAQRNIPL